MGDHKKTHCRKGHELTPANRVENSDGMSECRKCRYTRENVRRRARRAVQRREAA